MRVLVLAALLLGITPPAQWTWVPFWLVNGTPSTIPYSFAIAGDDCGSGQHEPFNPSSDWIDAGAQKGFVAPFGGCLYPPADGYVRLVAGGLPNPCIVDIQVTLGVPSQWFTVESGPCVLTAPTGDNPESITVEPGGFAQTRRARHAMHRAHPPIEASR
jgi:hypothetical protein